MRLSLTHPLASRALARLQDESGIALVMALGILFVLAIVLTTTIFFTSASVRHANTSNAGQKAYALAEAGVNNAIAQIAPRYPNSTIPGDSSWVGIPVAVPYGTNWSGSFDPGTSVWSLTGTGTVKNPTGGADITRTVRVKVPVSLQPPPFTKYGLFVDDSTGPTCTSLHGNNTITVPVYAKGCLSLGGGVSIVEPAATGPTTVSADIGGQLSVSGSAHVGTDAREINWLAAGGGCIPHPAGVPCGDVNNTIRAQTYGAFAAVSLPGVDVNAQYGKAKWSTAICSTGSNPFDDGGAIRDNSRGTTNLMGSSYDCTARDSSGSIVGQLGWNSSTTTPLSTPSGDIPPRTLRISGSVFVDGNLALAPSDGLRYSGNGTIYLNGTVDIKGTICGPGSSWDGNTCGKTWSPLAGLGSLLIVASNSSNANPAVNFGSQAVVEAGLWALGNVDSTGGPWLGGSVFVDNGSADITGGGGLQAFINLPAGAPTGGQYALGTPYEYR